MVFLFRIPSHGHAPNEICLSFGLFGLRNRSPFGHTGPRLVLRRRRICVGGSSPCYHAEQAFGGHARRAIRRLSTSNVAWLRSILRPYLGAALRYNDVVVDLSPSPRCMECHAMTGCGRKALRIR